MTAAFRPGDVFVDVGANAGHYALLASRFVGSRGIVIAFEPSPVIRERLARNVALNRLSNVTIRPEALSRERGVSPFSEEEGLAARRQGRWRPTLR
jgi:FkbM family methyltransferase